VLKCNILLILLAVRFTTFWHRHCIMTHFWPPAVAYRNSPLPCPMVPSPTRYDVPFIHNTCVTDRQQTHTLYPRLNLTVSQKCRFILLMSQRCFNTSLSAMESATQQNVMSQHWTTSAALIPFLAPCTMNSRH